MDLDETLYFSATPNNALTAEETLHRVYRALQEKGYEGHEQLVGYLLSGDPTYITSYQDARNLLRQYSREDYLRVLLKGLLDG